MRDLINIVNEHLMESSTGLANRKEGENFTAPDGSKMKFHSVAFYPTGGGKFETPEQMDAAIAELEKTLPFPIAWENNRTNRLKSFGVAIFKQDTKIFAIIGKFFESIKTTFAQNYFPNSGDNYAYAGKASAKEKAGFSPLDILTKTDNLTSEEILNQVRAKFGDDHPMTEVFWHVASDGKLPYTFTPLPDMNFTAFRDYFCELIHPVALQLGTFKGTAKAAAKLFLGVKNFEQTSISFNKTKTSGLSDSILSLPNGKFVRVSSKGSKGADASVKNLLDCAREMALSPAGQKIAMKYADTIEILEEVNARGQYGAPLYLAVKYGLMSEADVKLVMGLRNKDPINLANIDNIGLPQNLVDLAKSKATRKTESVDLFIQLINATAHKVVEIINTQTNFSEAAAAILNNGALIQIYTQATENRDTWVLESFTAVYPGDSASGVQISATKNYFATAITGNLTFKVLRDGEKAAPELPGRAPAAPPAADSAKTAAAKAQQIVEPTINRQPAQSGNVGREKRAP